MRVTFITKEQLLEMQENEDEYTLVDVLLEEDYVKGHLPFAVSLPVDRLADEHATVLGDKTRTVVVYCADYMCHASTKAARGLMRLGYARVLDYKGGKKDWTAAGLPLMTGKQ